MVGMQRWAADEEMLVFGYILRVVVFGFVGYIVAEHFFPGPITWQWAATSVATCFILNVTVEILKAREAG